MPSYSTILSKMSTLFSLKRWTELEKYTREVGPGTNAAVDKGVTWAKNTLGNGGPDAAGRLEGTAMKKMRTPNSTISDLAFWVGVLVTASAAQIKGMQDRSNQQAVHIYQQMKSLLTHGEPLTKAEIADLYDMTDSQGPNDVYDAARILKPLSPFIKRISDKYGPEWLDRFKAGLWRDEHGIEEDFKGAKHNPSMTITDISKAIKSDLTAAGKKGQLPKATYSVTKSSNTVYIVVKTLPSELLPLYPIELLFNPPQHDPAFAKVFWENPKVEKFKKDVEALAKEYVHDRSDSQSDYYNANAFISVSLDSSLTKEGREAFSDALFKMAKDPNTSIPQLVKIAEVFSDPSRLGYESIKGGELRDAVAENPALPLVAFESPHYYPILLKFLGQHRMPKAATEAYERKYGKASERLSERAHNLRNALGGAARSLHQTSV